MDSYETDGSSALDPVFNNDSNVDEGWRDVGPNLHTIDGGGQGGPASDRSNFSVVDGGKNAERNADAKGVGREAENGAIGKKPGAQDAKQAESVPFANNVLGKKQEGSGKKKGFARALAPTGIIMTILGAVVALVASTQWLFPFGLVANGLDQFNVLRTSMNRRTNVILRMQMDTNRTYTSGGIFSKEHFKISKGLQKKFAKNGIQYIDDAGGVRILYYEDADTGERLAVAANSDDASKIPDTIRVKKMIDGEEVEVEVSVTKKLALMDAIEANDNFNLAQNKATRTIRGHIAGWFDSISAAFHGKISNFRNKFFGTSKTADDEEIKADAKRNVLSTDFDGVEAKKLGQDDGTGILDEEEFINKDTGQMEKDWVVKGDELQQPGSFNRGSVESGDLKTELDERAKRIMVGAGANDKAEAIARAEAGVNITCMVLRSFGAITMTIATLQMIQILNYVTGFLEAIDQTKAGDGGSVLAFYMGPEGWSKMGQTKNALGEAARNGEVSNSMLAKPTKAFFGGSPVQPDDEVALKFNVDYAAQHAFENKAEELAENDRFWGGLPEEVVGFATNASTALAAYQACNMSKIVLSGVEMALTMAEAISWFVTGGMSFAVSALKEAAEGILEKAAFGVAAGVVGILIGAIIPIVAQWLVLDLVDNMAGEDAAYALSSGFNIYAGRQMQQSSGMPGNRAEVAAQFRQTQQVIAEEAKYERMTRSPFDVTSKNTFLGSLAHAAIPIATTMKFSPIFSTVSQVANTVGSSITALLPTVKAAGEEAWYKLSANEDCPSLSTIGVVGDAYCNPYFVSDYSTLEEDPYEVFKYLCERGSFEEGCNTDFPDVTDAAGNQYPYNPVVDKNSDFSKWIVSCAYRESQFGYIDDRISSWSFDTGNVALDTIAEAGIGAIEFADEFLEIADSMENFKTIDWSTGAKCSSGSDDVKMFSRYSEDQRLFESEGIIAESSVGAFMREYYKENPLDNSLEGVIARYSGMSIEKVNETLDTIAYVNYVANYDASERRQFSPDGPEKTSPGVEIETSNMIVAESYVLLPEVVFDDLRSRVLIV